MKVNGRKDKDQAQELHQDLQDKRKYESSNPISHEDCHPIDWRMEFLFISLGPRIFILKSIGGHIILNFHWFLKDEEAIDWRGRFWNFHWTRGTSSRKGHGRLTKWVDDECFFGEEAWRRKRRRNMKKRISSYVWRNVVHEREVCKQRAWKEVCV